MKPQRPRISIRTSRLAARSSADVLSPARIPVPVDWDFSEAGPDLLNQSMVGMDIRLKHGIHSIRLNEGFSIEVDVAPESTARAAIRTSGGDDSTDYATLESMVTSFDKPLVIRNVFGMIRGYGGLFENREVTVFVDRLMNAAGKLAGDLGTAVSGAGSGMKLLRKVIDSATGRVPEMADFARKNLDRAGELFATFVGEPVALEISRVSIHPKVDRLRPDSEPVLVVSISGSLVLSRTGTRAAFREIEVPSVIAPRPGTRLADFFKGRTMTGGHLRQDALVLPSLFSDIAAVVESISGRLDAEISPPVLEASWRSPDRTDSRLSVWTAQPTVSISTHFEAAPDGPEASILLRDLTVKSSGSRRTFVCEASLTARFGFDAGRIEVSHVSGTLTQTNRGSLPVFLARVSGENPFVVSGNALTLQIDELKSCGTLGFSIDAGGEPSFSLPGGSACMTGIFSLPEQQFGSLANGSISGSVNRGRIECTVTSSDDGTLDVSTTGIFPAAIELNTEIRAVPELNLVPGTLTIAASAIVKSDFGASVRLGGKGHEMSVTPRGGAVVELEQWRVESVDRCIRSAAPITAKATVRQGTISTRDEGDFTVDLCWTSASSQVLVETEGQSVSHRLPSALVRGTQTIHLSPSGRLNIAPGRRSFVRPEIWNALMYPATQAGALLDLLNDDAFIEDSLTSIAELVDLFNDTLGARFFAIRDMVLSIRNHLKDLGVRKPGDIFDEHVVARLFSRILVNDDSLVAETLPIIHSVNRGKGLDTKTARLLVLRHRPDIGADYETNWILQLVEIATTPVGVNPLPSRCEVPPLVDVPEIAARLKRIPSAATIYDWVSRPVIDPSHVARIVELAPMMYIDQINHIISMIEKSGLEGPLAELKFILSAKKAVSRACGGDEMLNLYLIPRASVLAGFIGDLTGPIPDVDPDGGAGVPESILGPKDVAAVLEVNLAAAWQGVQHQLNNRMILELLRRRDGNFLLAVMSELSHDVSLNLAINLMAFFRQDQGRMRTPVDTEALFEEKTGLVVPRFEDFLAGGLRSRESYFAELHKLALVLIERGDIYRATRMKLREAVPARKRSRTAGKGVNASSAAARQSILAADALASRLGVTPSSVRKLSAAYQDAFDACAAHLRDDPHAFHADWFKSFWRRSEEAVRVAVCVRGHHRGDEHVREWLAQFDRTGAGKRFAQGGANGFDDTQALVDAFIDTLWFDPADRQAIRVDPLVRLLMDVPAGEYDLTIVSGMGVITDGSHGMELEAAFRRLAKTRGIPVLRSPTGLMRDLEFNARAIINVVETVKGPWGYLGYSQGCTNGLRAEHMLMTGTPRSREIASRMVTRNLVLSAANGSVHAASGLAIGLRFLSEGEKFVKPYQSLYSREFAHILQRGTRGLLDSNQATAMISGAWSLTMQRTIELHRNGVFADNVPTSTIRASVTPERLPDGLQYVYGMHRRLMPDAETDSQVATPDEVGYSTRISNARADVLVACDIGSRPIHTHHWGPIYDEAIQLMTADDAASHRYENPMDVYVFPWIDTNIRFGLIRRKS